MTASKVSLRQQAAFLRTGVTIGVIPAAAAIGWADKLIEEDRTTPLPTAIYDLSLAPATDVSTILELLSIIMPGQDPDEQTVRALLDCVRMQMEDGVADLGVAVRAAYDVARILGPTSPLWSDALILEDRYADARDGVYGSMAEIESEAKEWFAGFRGAAANYPLAAA